MPLFPKRLFFICVLFFPQITLAHSPIKGIGHFLNGVVHPVLIPEQLIVILGLGLWYGQHQPSKNTKIVLYFIVAITAGLIASESLKPFDPSIVMIILSVVICLLIITSDLLTIPFYQPLLLVLGIISGFLLGLDSVQDELSGKAKQVTLFGSGVGIYFLMLYAMAFSETFSHQPWRIIAVKILASWLSASALMVLALSISR